MSDLTKTFDIIADELVRPDNDRLADTDNMGSFNERFSHFFIKTGTQYNRSPLSFLSDRGIENRLFDNLIEFLPNGAIISGGFALSVLQEDKNSKDIDFFFTSESSFKETLDLFKNPPEDAWAYKGYKVNTDSLTKNSRYVMLEHEEGTRPNVQLLKMVWYFATSLVVYGATEEPRHVFRVPVDGSECRINVCNKIVSKFSRVASWLDAAPSLGGFWIPDLGSWRREWGTA